MTRKDALAIIRAMRETDARSSVVTIDRVANGNTTWSVKAVGRDVRATAKRAQEVFDALEKKHGLAAKLRASVAAQKGE